MAKQRDIFLEGAKNGGIDLQKAGAIFDLMAKFAEYGFNKSHSAAYAVVTFRTAYLKAHFPTEYMCALLSSVMGTQDKVQLYIHNANQMGLSVLPPDVNESEVDFTIKGGKIRIGMAAINNVGTGAVEAILEARERLGGFSDFYQFCDEVDMKAANKRCIESLVKAGTFDGLPGAPHRAQLLAALDEAVERATRQQREKASGQISLFSALGGGATEGGGGFQAPRPTLPTVPQMGKDEALTLEKELLGVYVSGHPLQVFGSKLSMYSTHLLAAADEIADGTLVVVGGLLTATRKAVTKKGQTMMSGTLEDLTGSLEVLFFPECYEKHALLLRDDAKLLVKGKFSSRDDERKLLASVVKPLSHLPILHLELPREVNGGELVGLRNVLTRAPGDTPIAFHFPHLRELVLAGEPFRVDPTEELLFQLRKLLGVQAVRLSDAAPTQDLAISG
jgi:DNA polymerase-3 subunit alpha